MQRFTWCLSVLGLALFLLLNACGQSDSIAGPETTANDDEAVADDIEAIYSASYEKQTEIVSNVIQKAEEGASPEEIDAYVRQELGLADTASVIQTLANDYFWCVEPRLNNQECIVLRNLVSTRQLYAATLYAQSNAWTYGFSDAPPFNSIFPRNDVPTGAFGLNDAFRHTLWNSYLFNQTYQIEYAFAVLNGSLEEAELKAKDSAANLVTRLTSAHDCYSEGSPVEDCKNEPADPPSDPTLREYYDNWVDLERRMDIENNARGIEIAQNACFEVDTADLANCVKDAILNSVPSGLKVLVSGSTGNDCATIITPRYDAEGNVSYDASDTFSACLIPIEDHPDFASNDIIYWGNGRKTGPGSLGQSGVEVCYYAFGFFGPCLTRPATMNAGDGSVVLGGISGTTSTVIATLGLPADACEGTFTVTNTSDKVVNYAVVGRNSIQPTSNGRGSLQVGESVDVNIAYPRAGDTLRPSEEDIGIFDEATNPAKLMTLLYAEPDESCTGNGSLDGTGKAISVNSEREDITEGEGHVYEVAVQAGMFVNVAVLDKADSGKLDLELFDPEGNRIPTYGGWSYLERGVFKAVTEGIYRIEIQAEEDGISYKLGVAEIDPPTQVSSSALEIEGTLSQFGDINYYELDVDTYTYILANFYTESNDPGFRFRTYSSGGLSSYFSSLPDWVSDNPWLNDSIGGNPRAARNAKLYKYIAITSTGKEEHNEQTNYKVIVNDPITEEIMPSQVETIRRNLGHSGLKVYTYEASEGEYLNIATFNNATFTPTRPTITDPNGETIKAKTANEVAQEISTQVLPPEEVKQFGETGLFRTIAGTYRIVVDVPSAETREINLGLYVLDTDSSLSPSAELISDSFDAMGEYRYYKFQGSAGDTFKISLRPPSSKIPLAMRVIDAETGNYLNVKSGPNTSFSNFDKEKGFKFPSEGETYGEVTLSEDGEYYAVIHGGDWVTTGNIGYYEGDFSFIFDKGEPIFSD